MKTLFLPVERVLVFGNQRTAIQAMLDYDYLCGKDIPSVVGCVIPGNRTAGEVYFFGAKPVTIPVFPSVGASVVAMPTSCACFASARSAFNVILEVLALPEMRTVTVIAEGIPERQARIVREEAHRQGKIVIGPATVGVVSPGRLKIGNAGGTMENVLANRLYQRGSIGIVSKSGGMLNELMTMCARAGDGVAEAVAVGGDRFPSTTLAEVLALYESDKSIKLILLLGEVGGRQEQEVAEAIAAKKITKPVVAWVSGVGATKSGVQFGHAGAMASTDDETAAAKNAALNVAGAVVPEGFAGLEKALAKKAKVLGLIPLQGVPERELPVDLSTLMRRGEVRHAPAIRNSIAPKVDGAASYGGEDIAEVSREKSLGYVIGKLWFKHSFSPEVCNLFELILRLTADHGPAVSGAHNAIVAARAGRDLVSSLASGLLTIGPRFGGAVHDAARTFHEGVSNDLVPYALVALMKERKTPIPGIGHKTKSRTSPDNRVTLLKDVAQALEGRHTYLEYALKVEEVTTRKKDSLILNVDGAIAAILLDVLTEALGESEVRQILEIEALNGFFILGRSIGMIGHVIDQKRLGEGLYRHAEWDILDV